MDSYRSSHESVPPPIADDRKSTCSNKILNDKDNRQLKKIYAKIQTIEECLSTLDIFKSIMQDADEMKSRIIRDVAKSIYISSFDEGEPIYDVQDPSSEIFLIFQGQVSLKIKKRVEPQKATRIAEHQTPKEEFVYEEVETYEKGEGFGEAEFIRGRTRDFRAEVKVKGSIIGRLHIESFEEVIENYKMRVYYKKLEMFKRCPLLSDISGNRLEFLVNSSKPVLLGMSKTLVKQGEHPKCLYLVSKGQLEFVNNQGKTNLSPRPLEGWKSKKLSRYFVNSHESKEKLQIRKVNQGAFIGDVEIAMNQPFGYDVVTASEKVYLYACDIRLLLSQIPEDILEQSKLFYQQKLYLQMNQLNEIKETRKSASQNSKFSHFLLTPDQIKIKKQIRNRYLNTIPFSLVDESSPQEIYKMIERKHSRIKTEIVEQKSKIPFLELFDRKSPSPKKRKHNILINNEQQRPRSFSIDMNNLSPLYKKMSNEKINSQRDSRSMSASCVESRKKKKAPSSPKKKITLPPIVSIAMMKNLTKQVEKKRKEKEQKNDVRYKLKKSEEYTMNHRMSEFVLKIQLMKEAEAAE